MKQILIVGAGLSGATTARLFAQNGYEVTVIDKRPQIGGNAYDRVDGNGIIVQPYGPHIFHTSDKKVFDFLSEYTEWVKYEHRVLAKITRDKLVPVPFNLTSLFELYPQEQAERIKSVLIEEIGLDKKVPILKLKEHESAEIRAFGDFVYQNIFYIYTLKQWGFKPEVLGETVMNRVPVYVSYEDRYFTDEYQYMPKDGFTVMIQNMLDHESIKVKLSTDACDVLTLSNGNIYVDGKLYEGAVVYTGCVDELFGYKYGVLPYRSLKFKFKLKNCPSYQKSAVVNYTTSKKYTRISEFTKFACQPKDKTVIVKEYSRPFKKGKNVPYYPIPIEENYAHYAKYQEEASSYPNLYLLGRLANYKYINMDVAVKNAMELYDEIIGNDTVIK